MVYDLDRRPTQSCTLSALSTHVRHGADFRAQTEIWGGYFTLVLQCSVFWFGMLRCPRYKTLCGSGVSIFMPTRWAHSEPTTQWLGACNHYFPFLGRSTRAGGRKAPCSIWACRGGCKLSYLFVSTANRVRNRWFCRRAPCALNACGAGLCRAAYGVTGPF